MKKLALFIHGLGGDAGSTWGQFPELIRAETKVAELYDVDSVNYDTGFFGSQPSLAACATSLKTAIENRYKDYSDIALIAHSQGGLIARSYIAERLNSHQPLRVSRLLTFATPHHGSGHATLLKRVLGTSQQVKDLDPNSEFLRALAMAWGQAEADRYVRTKYAVAAGDAIVGQVSAMGHWSPDYEVVSGVGHRTIVKPESASDTSFLIAKKFLLEEPLLPGGVEADYRAPLLRLNYLEAKETTRFIYAARVLRFIGRDAEIEKLDAFLSGPEQPFRWMVLYGSGGVGKSRLALELCLALRNEWHTGFLPQEGDEPDWGRWQPLIPTLIVVDYAARDTERTGKLLRALSGRGPADGTMRLSAPVRVLLIERMGKGDWLDKIVGTGTEKARVEACHASEDLPLLALSDPWPIFKFVLEQAKRPLPDKEETLAALDGIDPERRPLFAYFMADAIAAGNDVRQFDAERLLDDVINRARDKFWKSADATPKEERLLALATMTRGLPVSALDEVTEKLLPSWDIDRHPAAFLAMTGRESGETIPPLEPDIVGEHFALSCLAQKNLSDADRARLCELAWRFGSGGMSAFILRSHQDLPAHPMLKWVRKIPTSEAGWHLVWAPVARDLTFLLRSRDPDATATLLNDMRGVAASAPENWGHPKINFSAPGFELPVASLLWALWAEAATASIGCDLASLLENSALNGPQRGNTFFYENPLVTRDREAAFAALNDIRGVAAARDEASLWKTWTYAALGMMDEVSSRDPIAASILLHEILSVTEAKRGEDFMWRAMVGNIVNAAVRDWLEEMRDAAKAHYDAAAWEQFGKAALTLSFDLQWVSPCAVRALLDEMRGVAEARDETPLWEWWAIASFSLIVNLESRDPAVSRALVNDMLEAVETHPGAVGGWQTKVVGLVLKAAFDLTMDLASRDPVAARAFCADVLGLPDWLLQKMKFGE